MNENRQPFIAGVDSGRLTDTWKGSPDLRDLDLIASGCFPVKAEPLT